MSAESWNLYWDVKADWPEAWAAFGRAAGAFGGMVPERLGPAPSPTAAAVVAACLAASAAAEAEVEVVGGPGPAPIVVTVAGASLRLEYGQGRTTARLEAFIREWPGDQRATVMVFGPAEAAASIDIRARQANPALTPGHPMGEGWSPDWEDYAAAGEQP